MPESFLPSVKLASRLQILQQIDIHDVLSVSFTRSFVLVSTPYALVLIHASIHSLVLVLAHLSSYFPTHFCAPGTTYTPVTLNLYEFL